MPTQPFYCPTCGHNTDPNIAPLIDDISGERKCPVCFSTLSPSPDSATPSNAPQTGARRITIVQVAELAGVSVATVSNYLNDKGRMTEATRQRIKEAVTTLRFTPNSLVRAIRQRRTNILGVVTYGLHDLDQHSDANPIPGLLAGITDAADKHHYNLLLFTGWPHRISDSSGLDFLDGHIDGLMWISPKVEEPHMQTVIDARLPTVGVLADQLPEGAGFVAADNVAAMRKLVAEIVALGHTRIAYLGPRNVSDFIERSDGYRLGLQDAGITVDPILVAEHLDLNDMGNRNWSEYEKALDMWMAMPNRPTAIMVNKDRLAAYVIEHLRTRGIRVPEDVSVTGFDGSLLSEHLNLTTVRQDFHKIGELSAETLIKLIQGANVDECKVKFECEVILRGSIGSPTCNV